MTKQLDEQDHQQPKAPDQLEGPQGIERLGSFGLPMALGISITIALLLTGISMSMYFSSDLSRIDLSKPKYADIRRDVRAAPQETFDDEGPISQTVVQEAIKKLQYQQKELRELGDFTSPALKDEQLGIGK